MGRGYNYATCLEGALKANDDDDDDLAKQNQYLDQADDCYDTG